MEVFPDAPLDQWRASEVCHLLDLCEGHKTALQQKARSCIVCLCFGPSHNNEGEHFFVRLLKILLATNEI
jgi:hypothetical protein